VLERYRGMQAAAGRAIAKDLSALQALADIAKRK
jgi:hypothetical protein